MHTAGKIFVKTCLKAIRDTYIMRHIFTNMWNFPIGDVSLQQKGKV